MQRSINSYSFPKIKSLIHNLNMPSKEERFATFTLPDITKVDPTKITKFSKDKDVPKWRRVGGGLNLQGKCKNSGCKAYKQEVWIQLGCGTFHMSEQVCKAKCLECKKPTRGNLKIGIYGCQLTGRGMKVKETRDAEETGDEDNDQQQSTGLSDELNQRLRSIQDLEEVQEEFQKIVCDSKEGILKMDGVNGKFVQWRYMTLQIKQVPVK